MRTLYFEYYVPKNGGEVCTERQQELLQAIHHNLAHPTVDRVVVFANETIAFQAFDGVEILVLPATRMTFQEIFDYANANTGPDDVHILCNTDIALSRGFETLEDHLGPDDFFCLSRYELSGRISSHAYGSQDTWIWRGQNRIQGVDFHLGTRGCDCHLIGAARRAFYEVTNPSEDLVTIHWHESNMRNTNYYNDQVRSPWFGVEPSKLGVAGEVCRFLGVDDWPVIKKGRLWTRCSLKKEAARRFGVQSA